MKRDHPFEFICLPEYREEVKVKDKKHILEIKKPLDKFAGIVILERTVVFKVIVQTRLGRLTIKVDSETYSKVRVGEKVLVSYRRGRNSQKLSGKIIIDY